jgi:putative membrane protein
MFWHWSYSSPLWWWWFPFHGLVSLMFMIAIIVLLVAMVRPRRLQLSSTARSQANQILEERYARGEIQREEYLQKKQDLHG